MASMPESGSSRMASFGFIASTDARSMHLRSPPLNVASTARSESDLQQAFSRTKAIIPGIAMANAQVFGYAQPLKSRRLLPSHGNSPPCPLGDGKPGDVIQDCAIPFV
jgi:hypothetical protein